MEKHLIELLRPFAKMVAEELQPLIQPQRAAKEKRIVRGIPGIMEIFQCSRSKASKIRKSGDIDGAITTSGNVFLIDVDKALELMAKKKGGRK